MSWDAAAKRAKEVQSDGKYLTLKDDGDSAVVVVLGEPVEFQRVFVDGKYAPYTDEHKAKGIKPQTRFRIAMWRPESTESQMYEATAAVVTEISKHASDLATNAFRLTRFGAAKSTGTFYTFEPERALDAAEVATARDIPRPDMTDRSPAASAASGTFETPFG